MACAFVAITRLVNSVGILKRDEAQDLLEYGLLMSLIAIGALLAVSSVGHVIDSLWWGPIAQSF
jgi:Flp pilus assembly pilin Flp